MILLDEHGATPGIYAVIRTNPGRFYGARLFKSPDNVQFTPLFTATRRAVTGIVTGDPLRSIRTCWLPDRGPPLVVSLDHQDDELVTPTLEAFNAGANVARVGRELIQFRTATLEEDGSWHLSHFRRGLQGTDWAVGTHVPAEAFELFSTVAGSAAPGIYWIDATMHELGATRYYQAVTQSQAIGTGTAVVHTGETLRPWAPVHLRGIRNGVTGDIVLSCRLRSRFSPSPRTGVVEQPDPPDVEFDIHASPGGPVVRTIRVTGSSTVVYTFAMQASDFPFGTPDPLEVIAYHLSAYVGRGAGKRAGV